MLHKETGELQNSLGVKETGDVKELNLEEVQEPEETEEAPQEEEHE